LISHFIFIYAVSGFEPEAFIYYYDYYYYN